MRYLELGARLDQQLLAFQISYDRRVAQRHRLITLGVLMDDLSQTDCRARKKLLILDACRSSAAKPQRLLSSGFLQSLGNPFKRPLYVADMVQQADLIGFGSLPIVLAACFFTGAALALNSATTLGRFGAVHLVCNTCGADVHADEVTRKPGVFAWDLPPT